MSAEERAEGRKHLLAVLSSQKLVSSKESFAMYTSILFWLVPVLLWLTLFQLHDPWEGDMWAFPDEHGWAMHVQWAVNLSSELLVYDHDSRAIVDTYKIPHGELERYDSSHPSHPASIARVVQGHWQYDPLWVAMVLNAMLVLSWLSRTTFLAFRWKFWRMILTLNVLWVSTVAQFFATGLRFYVFVFMQTRMGAATLCINGFAFIVEIVSVHELYSLRKAVLFLARQYQGDEKLIAEEGARLDSDVTDEEVDQAVEQAHNDPQSILAGVMEFIVTSRENFNADAQMRKMPIGSQLRHRFQSRYPNLRGK
jgi:hypothetical protein